MKTKFVLEPGSSEAVFIEATSSAEQSMLPDGHACEVEIHPENEGLFETFLDLDRCLGDSGRMETLLLNLMTESFNAGMKYQAEKDAKAKQEAIEINRKIGETM